MNRRSVLMAMAGVAGAAALPRVAMAAVEPKADDFPIFDGLMSRWRLSTGKMVCDGRELWAECVRLSRGSDREIAKYPIYGSIGGGEWGPQTGWSVKATCLTESAARRLWGMANESGAQYMALDATRDGGWLLDVRWGDDVVRPYRGTTTWSRMAGA